MWFGIGKVDFPHFVDSFLTKQGIQMHKKCLNGKKEVLILLSQLESKDWKFLHFHEERRKRLGKVRPQKNCSVPPLPPPCSILQNQGKTTVLSDLPCMEPALVTSTCKTQTTFQPTEL